MNQTAQHDFVQRDGLRTLHIEIDYDVQPIRYAVINAPPERCHPAEGGITVEAVRVVGMSLFVRDGTLLAEIPEVGHTLHPTIAGMFEAWLKVNTKWIYWQQTCEEAEDRAEELARAMYEYHAENKSDIRRLGIC